MKESFKLAAGCLLGDGLFPYFALEHKGPIGDLPFLKYRIVDVKHRMELTILFLKVRSCHRYLTRGP